MRVITIIDALLDRDNRGILLDSRVLRVPVASFSCLRSLSECPLRCNRTMSGEILTRALNQNESTASGGVTP